MIVAAGVSALQPLLAIAGADAEDSKSTLPLTTKEGIQRIADVSSAAIRGNFTGPLVAAATFVSSLCINSKKLLFHDKLQDSTSHK